MTAQDDATPQPEPTPEESAQAFAAETAKLQAELAETKDRLLRSAAELENYRRRAEKEREDTAKYAITGFAREMLTVADNLRRALDSQPADLPETLKAFVSGVELTERELAAIFERAGVVRIDPMGEPFNHDQHQAMFEVETAEKPAGTVVQVLQPGYMLKERLLRPALVGVAKGGAQASTSQASNSQASPGPASGQAASEAYSTGGEPPNFDTKA